MKTKSLLIPTLLPLMFVVCVPTCRATEPTAPNQPWGLADLPKLATPSGLINFTRAEIRFEQNDLRQNAADLRAGKPRALVEFSLTGARLAGASSGAVTGARIAYHLATLNAEARAERLDTALPHAVAQAPDREFQRVVHAALHGAVTGNWNVGQAVAGDLGGQAVELAPAARKISTSLPTPRS
jgi:hypothetical protein